MDSSTSQNWDSLVIALGVVLQIIFGAAVPFLGLDVVGSVVALVRQFGSRRFSWTWLQYGFYGESTLKSNTPIVISYIKHVLKKGRGLVGLSSHFFCLEGGKR